MKYFKNSELACKSTGVVKLDSAFRDNLIWLREQYNKPMIVNSCCRSAAYNKQVGGHPNSLHVYDTPHHGTKGTAAIDIHMPSGVDKAELIKLALAHGWSVGVAKTYLHLDTRTDSAGLPQAVFPY